MKHKKYLMVTVLSLLVLLLTVSGITAQGPTGGKREPNAPAGAYNRLTYQGRLTNSSGAPLNSTVNIVFNLYDGSSALLWTSATRSVTPINGLFTVYLGDGSDPDLNRYTLAGVASIGVTVGSDPEMTPRQPLNTLVGYSNNSAGVIGSSSSDIGVFGSSNTYIGVLGRTTSLSSVGVFAYGAGPSGTALEIFNGGIKVPGAGVGTNTPVFIHKATSGTIHLGATQRTYIDHPLVNGDPNAILIITHNSNPGNVAYNATIDPTGVYYDASYLGGRWCIFTLNGNPIAVDSYFNVLVVKP